MPDWTGAGACPVCARPTTDECACGSAVTDGCGCVARCAFCGHRWRLRPETALLEGTLYGADYHTNRKTEGTAGFADKACMFHLHLDAIRRACPDLAGRRLLDVGSATGDFLMAARRERLDGCGIELSSFAVARAAERGLAVRCGTIEDVDDGPYDVLHASHVLEHVPDAPAFVRRVFDLLRAGGLALIEVPNEFDDVVSSLRRATGHDDGRRPGSPHLHFFGAASLRHVFGAVGFVERDFFTYSHRRVSEPGLSVGARLRHLAAVNVLLAIGDVCRRGRNLVLLLERPAA
jgi:SAM-dependent methyltransferase